MRLYIKQEATRQVEYTLEQNDDYIIQFHCKIRDVKTEEWSESKVEINNSWKVY